MPQIASRILIRTERRAGCHRELVRDGQPSPGIEQLLRECFAELADLAHWE